MINGKSKMFALLLRFYTNWSDSSVVVINHLTLNFHLCFLKVWKKCLFVMIGKGDLFEFINTYRSNEFDSGRLTLIFSEVTV